MPIAFPQDIIDEVISYLRVHSDRDTLHSCSVVSHSFFIPARRKLFYSITLENATAAQALYNLLKINRVSYHYIGELYVNASVDTWNDSDGIWIAKDVDQALPKILELTQCLTLISLKLATTRPTYWNSLSVELRSALVKQFQSPTLTEARIHRVCDVPSTIIINSPNLRKLILNGVFFSPSSPDVISIPRLVHLRQLELGAIQSFPLFESGMQNIRLLSTTPYFLPPMGEVVESSKHTIRSVLWDNIHHYSAINDFSVLNPISHLQRLYIAVATFQTSGHPSNPTLSSFVPHLSGILKSLEELTIFFENRYCSSWRDGLQLLKCADAWSRIDSALQNRSPSSVLKKVCICISTPQEPEPDASRQVQTLIEKCLPLSYRQGIVSAKIEHYEQLWDRVWSNGG